MVHVSQERFEELVGEALDRLPTKLTDMLDNVVITVEDHDEEGLGLLGLYRGIALTRRDTHYTFAMPDEITLFRAALMNFCADEAQLAEEIGVTIVHELGHHVGMDDARLHELGWG